MCARAIRSNLTVAILGATNFLPCLVLGHANSSNFRSRINPGRQRRTGLAPHTAQGMNNGSSPLIHRGGCQSRRPDGIPDGVGMRDGSLTNLIDCQKASA
jgi:hypothetical protein